MMMMIFVMIMMIMLIMVNIFNLASNDLATWIGEYELPGGRHLVKDVDYDNGDGDDDDHDGDGNDDDDHNRGSADTKTYLRTLSAFVIRVWNEAGHPSTLVGGTQFKEDRTHVHWIY